MSVGDYVAVCPEADNEPFYVARVTEMWEESGEKMFHGSWFNRGRETVLGETGDPTELFLVDSCDDTPLYAILQQVFVKYVPPPANWCELGGVEVGEGEEEETDNDAVHFFYQKWYDADTARFEDLPPQCQLEDEKDTVECYSCIRKQVKVSSLSLEWPYIDYTIVNLILRMLRIILTFARFSCKVVSRSIKMHCKRFQNVNFYVKLDHTLDKIR